VNTSSGKVVATSFLYLTVHRKIAGDVPVYQKFALKVTHPSENADLDRFRLIVPQPWRLARKIQLALIVSGPRCLQPAINEPCTLHLSPPKGGSNREYYPRGASDARVIAIIVCLCVSKLPTPSENGDFDRFRLIVPQPWELARIAIIANRKSTTRFLSSHRWTLCVTPKPPKCGSKWEFLHLALLSLLRCRSS